MAPQSFCPCFCISALTPQPQSDPKEAEPCGSAAPPVPRAGRCCLHILGMDQPLPQPTQLEPLMPAVLQPVRAQHWHCLGTAASGTWDKEWLLSTWLHWGFARDIKGSHQLQRSTLLPCAFPSKPGTTLAAGTSQMRCAGSEQAVCGWPAGSVRAHGKAIARHGGLAGGSGTPTPAPGCEQGVGKGVCFPLRGRPWSCFLSAVQEP